MSGWHERMGGVLVLGARGMLGHELVARWSGGEPSDARRHMLAWDVAELDIRDREAVHEAIARVRPALVLNAAAYTDVDGCESNVDLAMAVNAVGPGHLAEACAEHGCTLVHFGTDYVFDGQSDRPYQPDDATNPLSVYGRSKWDGEQAVRAGGCHHLIIRTAWLFGSHGRNFVEAILQRLETGGPLRVVNDQVGSPTSATDLAEAVERLLDRDAEGTVHFTDAGQCSWFEFAQEIVRQAGFGVSVEPISSEELARPARRPAYSVLDLSRYRCLTKHDPAPWPDALRRYFDARRGRTADEPHAAGGAANPLAG